MKSGIACTLLGVAASLAASGTTHTLAQATGYPARVIRIIVPFAPGPGPNDFLARFIGQKLFALWGQQCVIENRGGAGGTIGVEAGAKSPPDGYTLVMGAASTLTVAPNLYANLPYDPVRDLTPIAALAAVPYALIVNPGVPAKSVKELTAIARSKKGFLHYGSSGVGSMSHLAAELFNSATGVDITHVPYKGTPLAMTDIISGYIDLMFNNLAAVQPHEKAGRLRVLALTNSRRAAIAPGVPTMSEAGVRDYSVEPWYGIVAPAGTPVDIIAKLNAAIVAALKTPESRQHFEKMGYEVIGSTAGEFAAMIKANIESYGQIIRRTGIRPQP
ncbi:MAG: tripartite tricarboxylate transporter substrate binding protein [Burkholderiales bacterium]|nr:tripartite tricarboxylate transporter substrate binding protein [Burkholderiales bacterium]